MTNVVEDSIIIRPAKTEDLKSIKILVLNGLNEVGRDACFQILKSIKIQASKLSFQRLNVKSHIENKDF